MKKILCLLIGLSLLLILSPSVLASSYEVCDDAGLLSDGEKTALCDKAKKISDDHGVAVLILTVDGLQGKETWELCDDHFYNGGYGDDGILLLLSMEYRDWEIATYGSVASRISDSRTGAMFDAMSEDLAKNRYYEGFCVYLAKLENALSKKTYSENTWLQFAVSLGIGVVVALITILIMRGSMNTVRPQRTATDYMLRDSSRITSHRDIFLYSNTTRTRRAQSSSSGGGSRGGSRGKF